MTNRAVLSAVFCLTQWCLALGVAHANDLDHPDLSVRIKASRDPKSFEGPNSFAQFEKALSDENPVVRAGAAELLWRYEGANAEKLFKKAWNDEDYLVQVRSSQALGKFKGRGALDLLATALNHEQSAVRIGAVSALPQHQGDRVDAMWANTMRYFDPEKPDLRSDERAEVALAMRDYRGKYRERLFEMGSRDAHPRVRQNTARSLRYYDGENAQILFTRLAGDKSIDVRNYTYEALSQYKGPDAEKIILDLLRKGVRDAEGHNQLLARVSSSQNPEVLDAAAKFRPIEVKPVAAPNGGNSAGPNAGCAKFFSGIIKLNQ